MNCPYHSFELPHHRLCIRIGSNMNAIPTLSLTNAPRGRPMEAVG
jgi:hypothetical protein